MENDYRTAKIITCDPSTINPNNEGLKVVSFHIDVLDKYKSNIQNYELELSNNVGTLSKKGAWSLQIDVHTDCGDWCYVNTWLYKLGSLPNSEQEHFIKYHINARELSKTAHQRWIEGIP